MRHVAQTFLESTLTRGKPLEQFMGSVSGVPAEALRWLEVRLGESRFEVWVHDVEDVGNESWIDIYAFPYVQGDPPDAPAASFSSAGEALAFAYSKFGARATRWVNQLVAQDEYSDYLHAGRSIESVATGT